MRVNLNLLLGTVAIVATGAILYAVMRKGKTIAAAAGDVAAAVNPLNPNNIAIRGADAITRVVTGDQTASFTQRLIDALSSDRSGAIATAPSLPTNSRGSTVQIAQYWQQVEQDDIDAGYRMREAIAADDPAFNSSEGGAPFGNPLIMRQGVRYGATRYPDPSAYIRTYIEDE